jgi:site-specific DNA-adenine methylase
MQTQVTPPAVLHLAVMKAEHRIDTNGDLVSQPASPTETYGVNPQVAPKATSGKLSPKECTTEQLFEIVIDVARRFRTAKEVVAEHKDYILRLKTEVFKVRFGSFGVKVPVKCNPGYGRPQTRRMAWKEFCESQFGVSADWINRVCGGKAEGPGQAAAAEKRTMGSSMPVKLTGRQQVALIEAQLATNDLVVALKGGADWQTPLDEYEKVAVTPEKLDTFLNALSLEPDWKTVLVKLVYALDQCRDSLPVPANDALNAVKEVLGGKSDQQQLPSGKPKATWAAKSQRRAANNKENKPPCAFPAISYPGGKARLARTLVSLMPRQGRSYVEPFAGRGNVFWAAASSQLGFRQWALNDIRTVPFFEAVRDIGDTVEVPEKSCVEYSRQREAFRRSDPKAILLEPYFTFSGDGYGRGLQGKNGPTAAGYTRTLRACHRLLHTTKAIITGCDWTEFDWSSLTHDDFVFIDPPYLGGDVRSYKENDLDHEDLVRLLKAAKFKWMLTEYAHELYFRELGQPFFIKDMQLNAPNFRVTRGKERRLECVWKNY